MYYVLNVIYQKFMVKFLLKKVKVILNVYVVLVVK